MFGGYQPNQDEAWYLKEMPAVRHLIETTGVDLEAHRV
jgi:hypothetical protein